jgi:hypothetical protein
MEAAAAASAPGRKAPRRKHEHEEDGELPAEAAAAVFRALVDEFPGAGGAALDWRACVRAFGLEHDSAASERLVALLGGGGALGPVAEAGFVRGLLELTARGEQLLVAAVGVVTGGSSATTREQAVAVLRLWLASHRVLAGNSGAPPAALVDALLSGAADSSGSGAAWDLPRLRAAAGDADLDGVTGGRALLHTHIATRAFERSLRSTKSQSLFSVRSVDSVHGGDSDAASSSGAAAPQAAGSRGAQEEDSKKEVDAAVDHSANAKAEMAGKIGPCAYALRVVRNSPAEAFWTLLWALVSICLFLWKFLYYRFDRPAAFAVMGYCIRHVYC